MIEAHERVVEAQFGPRAKAYVESAVHSQGADLEAIGALAQKLRPSWRSISAPAAAMSPMPSRAMRGGSSRRDLSSEMLAAVARTAREKGLGNIETAEAPAERLPFEDETFDFVASRFSAHHWRDFERRLAGGAPHARNAAGGRRSSTLMLRARRCSTPICRRSSCCATIPMSAITLARNGWTRSPALASPSRSCRTWRLRMDFPVWIARMRTPEEKVKAIRALQIAASAETKAHFAIEPDGSFLLDVLMIEALGGVSGATRKLPSRNSGFTAP